MPMLTIYGCRRKLRCIAVSDKLRGSSNIILKRELGPGLVELRSGPKAERCAQWLMVTKILKPGMRR